MNKRPTKNLTALTRALRADPNRRTRLHTLSGQLVLSTDIFAAFATTLGRMLFNHYADIPWLTYPSVRFLDDRLRGRSLFEFGSGASTKWFGERCSEVYSVENDPEWFAKVEERIGSKPNVHLKFAKTDADFVSAIASTEKKFDAIVVDCQPVEKGLYHSSDDFRVACLRAAIANSAEDCLFVIDNTDAMVQLSEEIRMLFPGRQIHRFPGWAPGIFHPNETTIVA